MKRPESRSADRRPTFYPIRMAKDFCGSSRSAAAGKASLSSMSIFDEPESALSPSRQIEFLKLLRRMDKSGICQVIMATHSPMLMAYPAAQLLRLSKYGLEPVRVSETDHYRLMREFCADPETFIDTVLSD
jgi:predicted ATPase